MADIDDERIINSESLLFHNFTENYNFTNQENLKIIFSSFGQRHYLGPIIFLCFITNEHLNSKDFSKKNNKKNIKILKEELLFLSKNKKGNFVLFSISPKDLNERGDDTMQRIAINKIIDFLSKKGVLDIENNKDFRNDKKSVKNISSYFIPKKLNSLLKKRLGFFNKMNEDSIYVYKLAKLLVECSLKTYEEVFDIQIEGAESYVKALRDVIEKYKNTEKIEIIKKIRRDKNYDHIDMP